jgi:hypothetical protein
MRSSFCVGRLACVVSDERAFWARVALVAEE